MIGILIKRENLDTNAHTGRISWEDGGRDLGEESTCQGMPQISSNQQKLAKRHRTESALQPSEKANPADTFISDF